MKLLILIFSTIFFLDSASSHSPINSNYEVSKTLSFDKVHEYQNFTIALFEETEEIKKKKFLFQIFLSSIDLNWAVKLGFNLNQSLCSLPKNLIFNIFLFFKELHQNSPPLYYLK